MKTEELLQAIGSVEESILAESELFVTRKPKRTIWRLAAAAALVSLLAVTAYAAGFDFVSLLGISHGAASERIDFVDFSVEEDGVAGELFQSGTTQGIQIRAQIPTNPDAPRALAQAYLPRVPDHWVSCDSWYALSGGDFSQFGISWEPFAGGDGTTDVSYGMEGYISEDCVSFRQYSAYFYNKAVGGENTLDTLLGIPERVKVTSEVTSLGGISVLRVDIPAFRLTEEEMQELSPAAAYMEEGEIHLFWSDGNSIFQLTCPGWFRDSQLEDLLTGLYPVEDMQAYLDELIK